jgi:hypothetical protein
VSTSFFKQTWVWTSLNPSALARAACTCACSALDGG